MFDSAPARSLCWSHQLSIRATPTVGVAGELNVSFDQKPPKARPGRYSGI